MLRRRAGGHPDREGWDDIYTTFDLETPDIQVVINEQGLLESVEGRACHFQCDGWGWTRTPVLDGQFDGVDSQFVGTCETTYNCEGWAFTLWITGADTTAEWEGALWNLFASGNNDGYPGASFGTGDEWNLGRADVPYEGCVPACTNDGQHCGLDGCGGSCGFCTNGDCDTATNTCVEYQSCSATSPCPEGYFCEETSGTCLSGSCVSAGGSCQAGTCCSGSTCVVIGDTAACLQDCTAAAQCSSDCCWPLDSGGSVCVTSDYCASCAAVNAECSPSSNPCCPGAACIWVDGVGARCQAQSAECPAGCESSSGSSCCRPPFCAGECSISPCCL